MAPPTTAIQPHGAIASEPTETYGEGKVILRIGNGGAGATGLIEALAKDYLTTTDHPGSIQWICNHSRNTQLALRHGYIDIALTYERDQEDISVNEGWAKNAGCMFHDHFCLAGPLHDPANVKQAKSIAEAFDRIAAGRWIFHTRFDGSATMWKERKIWHQTHRQPWVGDAAASWYIKLPSGPAESVARADADGAYLLCDRSTLLTQVSRGAVSNLTVFFEPTDRFHDLINSCYALTSPTASAKSTEQVSSFLNYVESPRGQSVIAKYGCEKVGVPVFTAVDEGYARLPLKGGQAKNNHWTGSGRVLGKL